MIAAALLILAFVALICVPIWMCLTGYKDGLAKIARERETVDQLTILKTQEEFRQRDVKRASAQSIG